MVDEGQIILIQLIKGVMSNLQFVNIADNC